MRCYFMKNKHIEAVEFLTTAPDDELIQQAEALFRERAGRHFDGFEVWDGRRFVYRFPKPTSET